MAKKAARAPKRSATPARRAARTSTPARKAAPRKATTPLRKSAARATTTAKAAKYVYSWGAGKADGNGTMKPLLGGKGANLAEMAPHRPAGACRLHDHHRGLHLLLRQQAHLPGGAPGADRGGHRQDREDHGRQVRRRHEVPAAGRGALRRARLDAGHDGHDPEPGPERRDGVALEPPRQNPRFAWDCYRRFIQMYGDVVLGVQKRAGEDHEPFETVIETYKHERYGNGELEDNKLTADDLKDDRRSLQGAREGAHRQGVPVRSVGAARGRGRRRVRLLDERPRDRLSPQVQHPGRVGHRRQRAGDGVRQHRRGVGFRRGVHARSGDRREGVLRRVPASTRRARTSSPACARRSPWLELAKRDAEGLQGARPHPQGRSRSTSRTCRTSSSPSRTARCTCSRRATASAPAWPRCASPTEMVKEGLIDWETAVMRVPADQLDQVLAPIFDRAAVKKAQRHRHRPAGRSRRGLRQDLLQRRSRRGSGGEGQEGAARPRRDLARGSARHDRGRRHPDGARRRVLARGARGPPDGQGLRVRRRGAAGRLRQAHAHRRRHDLQRGRLALDRRHGRRGLRRPDQDRRRPR